MIADSDACFRFGQVLTRTNSTLSAVRLVRNLAEARAGVGDPSEVFVRGVCVVMLRSL